VKKIRVRENDRENKGETIKERRKEKEEV